MLVDNERTNVVFQLLILFTSCQCLSNCSMIYHLCSVDLREESDCANLQEDLNYLYEWSLISKYRNML